VAPRQTAARRNGRPADRIPILRVTRTPPSPFAQSDAEETPAWKIFRGDAEAVLKQLDDASIDCMVTSPPYFWQRDYAAGKEEIGKEPSIAGYVGAITDVMSEVRRVLKPTGTAWLNLGDSYYNAKGKPHGSDPKHQARNHARRQLRAVDGPGLGLPRKSLIGIPWRVALSLQEEGWTLRSDIVWHRKTSMPEPTSKDRTWGRHEHIFLLVKSAKYHFNRKGLDLEEDVWDIAPERQSAARGEHYAPYPPELVRRCLRAGCPPDGIVLDPFAGGGTTLVAARELGRSAIGIDLSKPFCELMARRMRELVLQLDDTQTDDVAEDAA
jgi:DNA modification methylase